MKSSGLYFYVLISVLALSCRPEALPPVETGQPVFSFSGGGVDITAGEEDFYLFTDYQKDASNVYSFIARFAKTSDCATDCEEELVIEIRDVQQTFGFGTVDIDNALHVGSYDYTIANPPVSNNLVIVDFTAEPEGTGPFIYSWTTHFNNSIDTFTTSNPAYSRTFDTNLNISFANVCLAIQNNFDCEMEYCNTIFLQNNNAGCKADFQVFNSPASVMTLEADTTGGVPPFTYNWSNGATTSSITQPHNGGVDQTFCLTITDGTGCSDEICKAIKIVQGTVTPQVCASRFQYEKSFSSDNPDSLQLKTVLIRYVDPGDQEFRSDLLPQSNTDFFTITEVGDYELNENGDKTKKLKISGSCRLYHENGNSIDLPFEGVIAVAYP